MSFESLENLKGQVAVVVGAGGSIGSAVSKKLARCGARIIGIVRNNAKELQNIFDQFDNSNLRHKVILADNTKTEEFKEATMNIAPLLKKSSHGLIVNISSASALHPRRGSNIAYAAAKAGLESMTKNLALAFAPGIRVISICPSAMNTGFLELSDEFYEKEANDTPLKRIPLPDDVASVVEACATNMRFVTGNCFVVDGGRLL